LVELQSDGSVLVNGQAVSEVGMQEQTRAALARSPDVRVVITAARSVAYGRLMHALDVMHLAGASRFGFAMPPVGRESPDTGKP